MNDKDHNNNLSDENISIVDEQSKPDEKFGFYFSSAITIKDIDTGEIILKIRGD